MKEILNMDGDVYIGVQYAMGGLLCKAWRNENFIEETLLAVSDAPKGWQYLPLQVFKKMCRWAVNPDNYDLSGIEWQGKPFGTVNLYRVTKTVGDEVKIGIRGGLNELKKMSVEEIVNRPMWEISSEDKKSTNWFSGKDFCKVIENKKIQKVIQDYYISSGQDK